MNRIRTGKTSPATGWRTIGVAMIVALGLVAIGGSGGGFPDIGPFDGPFAPIASIDPSRTTVQVGATVVFTASAFGTAPLSYQWSRNGVHIAGANDVTFTLAGANLADDGARFSVTVSNSVGAGAASSVLHVSSLPGVTYSDEDFRASDWTVTAAIDPPTNGPTYTVAPSTTGGNPDAFRSITYQVPQGRSSVRLFHVSGVATYDPAVQGAIYTIDFALDCNRLSTSTISETYGSPAFEQGGRWFAPLQWGSYFCAPAWVTSRALSVPSDEFTLVAGPACGGTGACPDFAAGAAPIHFGFISGVNLPADAAAGSITQGIDNWTLTVWRR